MEMQWWGATIQCPECKCDTVLQIAMFSADGELKFTFWCPKCKELYHWRVFATSLQHQAFINDMEKAQRVIPVSRPLKPPLQIPPEKISEEDRNFMKDFHIDPDDPEQGGKK